MTHAISDRKERFQAARRATLISVVVNILLSVIKIAAGLLGHSAAMTADGVHSLSDLISDGAVWVTMRIAGQDADEDHPYGHGKFETLATQFIAVLLLITAAGVAWDAVSRLGSESLPIPTGVALAAALVSLLAKEMLFRYTLRIGQKFDAKALIANAWHHRSDALSSVAALIGIGGAMMGWPILDPLAALAVALMLGWMGIQLLRGALNELTDSPSAIDGEIQNRISHLVNAIDEVNSAHFLTPRRLGPDIVVDVHVVVDPFLSVSEGHRVAEKVRLNLLEEVGPVTEVMVHVDTMDDRFHALPTLSDRRTLGELARRELKTMGLKLNLEEVTPHYAPEGIILDLWFAAPVGESGVDRRGLEEEANLLCGSLLRKLPELSQVRASLVLTRTTRKDEGPIPQGGPLTEKGGVSLLDHDG